jgi:uncharacterized membrane protein
MSVAPAEANTWLIKRNCSAGPHQLALVFATLVAVSFAFGLGFAIFGLWMVLPFVGLELMAVGIAFFYYGRHAADFERIAIAPDAISVERVEGAQTHRWKLDPRVSHIEVAGPAAIDTWARDQRRAGARAWWSAVTVAVDCIT